MNLGLMEIRLVSASDQGFSVFGRRIFHPRPQDVVFRCRLNKYVVKSVDSAPQLDSFLLFKLLS
jgi:hypothetical protein